MNPQSFDSDEKHFDKNQKNRPTGVEQRNTTFEGKGQDQLSP